MSAAAAAAVAGGSQLLGGLFGFLGQRRQNRHNLRMAQDAREHDVNMWRMQNEYNTPEMQMQRLREAGLNPNLMYGQGDTGNASSPPKAPVPEVGNELAGLAQMSVLPALSMYQDFKVKNAQIDNLSAQAEATRQNAALTALRRITQGYTNTRLQEEQPYWANIAMSRSHKIQGESELTRFKAHTAKRMYNEALPSQIQNIILRNSLLNQQIQGQQLENELNEKLKPYGASSRDSLLQRLIMMHFAPKAGQKSGFNMSPKEAYKHSMRNLKGLFN